MNTQRTNRHSHLFNWLDFSFSLVEVCLGKYNVEVMSFEDSPQQISFVIHHTLWRKYIPLLPQFTFQHTFALQHRPSTEQTNRMITHEICKRLKFQKKLPREGPSLTLFLEGTLLNHPMQGPPKSTCSNFKSSSLQVFSFDVPLIAEANTPPWSTKNITRCKSTNSFHKTRATTTALISTWPMRCLLPLLLHFEMTSSKMTHPKALQDHPAWLHQWNKTHQLTQRLHRFLWPAQKHHQWKLTPFYTPVKYISS